MKNIVLIGPSYSGKSELAKSFFSKLGYRCYSVGDMCRKAGYPLDTCLDSRQIVDILVKNIDFADKSSPILIDNLFKTADTVDAIDLIEHSFASNVIVIEVNDDRRQNVDYSSRGRDDDRFISAKRSIWSKNAESIRKKLASKGIKVMTIYSIDGGFMVQKES